MPILLWCILGYALTARFAFALMCGSLQSLAVQRAPATVVSLSAERRRRRAA